MRAQSFLSILDGQRVSIPLSQLTTEPPTIDGWRYKARHDGTAQSAIRRYQEYAQGCRIGAVPFLEGDDVCFAVYYNEADISRLAGAQ